MPTLQIAGVRHFYRAEGDPARPALFLAHPVGFDHGLWDAIVPLLLADFHVVRYDLRGHGGSEVTPGEYPVAMLASDALAIIDALRLGPVHYYGVSLGGLVGLWIAAHQPRALRSLTVSNLAARLPLPREEWDRRIGIARSEGLSSFAAGMRERMFSAAFREANPSFHTQMNAFLATDPQGYASALAALRDADLTPMLPRAMVPTLVVHGRLDAAVAPEQIRLIADSVASGTLVTVEGGHLSPLESPVEVAKHLRRHIAGAVQATSRSS